MIEEIKEKLKKVLSGQIKGEESIVYTFVLIRKLLELSGLKGDRNYNFLKFVCDWVVHSKIDHLSPAREILEKISKAHNPPYDITGIINFIELQELKKQLDDLLKYFDIRCDLLNEGNWEIFRYQIFQSLKDLPLLGTVDPIKELIIKDANPGNIEFSVTLPSGLKMTHQWDSETIKENLRLQKPMKVNFINQSPGS